MTIATKCPVCGTVHGAQGGEELPAALELAKRDQVIASLRKLLAEKEIAHAKALGQAHAEIARLRDVNERL